MKKWIALSGALIIIMSLFTGCTSVSQVPVSEPAQAAVEQDLSLYIVEEAPQEEPKAVPLDPNLDYIDTATFTNLMETVGATTKRNTYGEYPPEWEFVVIDARPAKVYHEGHINGAINIPDAEFEQYKALLPADKDKQLIFYCGGLHCGLSKKSALKAKELGYTNVMVYQEGIPFWQEAGNYLTVTEEYVNSLIMETYVARPDYPPYVMFDVRPYSSYFAEHIPNSMQLDDTVFVEKYLDTMPEDKGTEIILYCGGFT